MTTIKLKDKHLVKLWFFYRDPVFHMDNYMSHFLKLVNQLMNHLERQKSFRGNYEIADAVVRNLDAQRRNTEDDIPFHLSLGSKTVIRSLDLKGETIYPIYQTLASIPSIPIDDDRHDILVLVLYVSEEPKRIVTSPNKETSARDLMVIDLSSDQPMKVCTWNDLAREQSESIVSNSDSFKVIGVTTLRPITRQGFSLESTMSTFILKDPQGDKAEALAEWYSVEEFSFLNIENSASTLPQEVFWLNVVTTDIEFERLRAYIGCSHCGKRTDLAVGTVYSCKACSRKDIHVAYRTTITFNVSDGTGSLELTAFTDVCDKLFRMPIQEIYEMKTMEQLDKF
ncbi:replication protein A 70 kDa DNA-binding subunit B-like [Chenopodium quinoa]|uniref:replication protein A 70 kDa DNA-binding subunit B-like n=1 Tax=Chenopodium quinoa TaxID=63459 RepID=UPI000B79242F|nr:replication protein A 70 kDa DNA-binding subunit B-like [Chenopodium quinoa]